MGSKKFPRGASQIILKNLDPAQWFYVYLNQGGLGWFQAAADGTVQLTTPAGTRPADNRFILFNAGGDLRGWDRMEVTGPK